ncbi:hypothetical protein LCGC14_2740390 [marine sediment metagenome]|uniref:Uncharacterized protein n=1 Tax=marine sediment metagenome TaxID=412755 RepID=A0A0F8Z4J3_9ZZZZ
MGKIKQLFCRHEFEFREWHPFDKEGQRLFKDTGVLRTCIKCGKHSILYPKIPMEETA